MTFKEKLETHRKVVILGDLAGTGQKSKTSKGGFVEME